MTHVIIAHKLEQYLQLDKATITIATADLAALLRIEAAARTVADLGLIDHDEAHLPAAALRELRAAFVAE